MTQPIKGLVKKLSSAINHHGWDNHCDVPDYILAKFLHRMLLTVSMMNRETKKHSGDPDPGPDDELSWQRELRKRLAAELEWVKGLLNASQEISGIQSTSIREVEVALSTRTRELAELRSAARAVVKEFDRKRWGSIPEVVELKQAVEGSPAELATTELAELRETAEKHNESAQRWQKIAMQQETELANLRDKLERIKCAATPNAKWSHVVLPPTEPQQEAGEGWESCSLQDAEQWRWKVQSYDSDWHPVAEIPVRFGKTSIEQCWQDHFHVRRRIQPEPPTTEGDE